MFNRTALNAQTVKDAARLLSEAYAKHDNTLRDISDNEIKSKDRVDISLEEYDQLKNELAILRSENYSLKDTLTRIGIPFEVMADVIPSSIKVQRCEDCIGFETSYRVTFSVRDIERRLR